MTRIHEFKKNFASASLFFNRYNTNQQLLTPTYTCLTIHFCYYLLLVLIHAAHSLFIIFENCKVSIKPIGEINSHLNLKKISV